MAKRLAIGSVLLAVIAAGTLYGIASARHGKLIAKMSGAQEVTAEGEPAGDSDGFGNARVRLLPDADRICYRLNWSNIGSPTAAHIHRGARGTNGDVVVPLFSAPQELPTEISGVSGCASDVSDELSNEIRENPRAFYVNVHNKDHPAGAIRGQLKHPR